MKQILILTTTLVWLVWVGSLSAQISYDANGYMSVAPTADSRVIYVSTSGNDSNDGLSPNTPKRTLSAGYALLRNGMPDQLLLRRGDVFNNETFANHFQKSGPSANNPMVLGSYGSSSVRPRIVTSGDGFSMYNSRQNIALIGLHFKSASGGGDGIKMIMTSGQNIYLEDLKIENYQNNFNLQGFHPDNDSNRIVNLRLRNSVIVDAAAPGGGHSQGGFFHNIDTLLIENNVFDRNGWSQRTNPGGSGGATIFNHSMYITTTNTDVTVRKNIVSDSSSHGMQLRSGGVVEDNLFVRNPLGMLFGGGDVPVPGGVTGSVKRNVILDGIDINVSTPRGFGLDLTNTASAVVSDNIIAHTTQANQPFALTFQGGGYGSGVGVNNALVERNIIYNWYKPNTSIEAVKFRGTNLSNITLKENMFQTSRFLIDHENANTVNAITSMDNQLFTTNGWFARIAGAHTSFANWAAMVNDSNSQNVAADYPDAYRSVATYNASLGANASHEAFMQAARNQSRLTFNPAYTAIAVNSYIREGFLGEYEQSVFGDLNGDQIVDISDLLILLRNWGACSGCPADLNEDGVVDSSDMMLLLEAWSDTN